MLEVRAWKWWGGGLWQPCNALFTSLTVGSVMDHGLQLLHFEILPVFAPRPTFPRLLPGSEWVQKGNGCASDKKLLCRISSELAKHWQNCIMLRMHPPDLPDLSVPHLGSGQHRTLVVFQPLWDPFFLPFASWLLLLRGPLLNPTWSSESRLVIQGEPWAETR